MCLLCAEPGFGAQGISVTFRPSHRLVGLDWEGSHAEAARGATHDLIRQVQRFSDQRASLWKGPLVGISWNDRPDGFRYFIGISVDEGEEAPRRFRALDLPDMRLAVSWHGASDGEVVDHYLRMIDWIREGGERWDKTHLHHREEYPADIDLAQPPALRLMLPVADEP